jgi:hypothetical protein
MPTPTSKMWQRGYTRTEIQTYNGRAVSKLHSNAAHPMSVSQLLSKTRHPPANFFPLLVTWPSSLPNTLPSLQSVFTRRKSWICLGTVKAGKFDFSAQNVVPVIIPSLLSLCLLFRFHSVKKLMSYKPIQTSYLFSYLVCEAIGIAATPGLLCQPRVIVKMIVEKQMKCRLCMENRSSRRKPAPTPLLSITKSHMTRPEFEPGPPRWEAGD